MQRVTPDPRHLIIRPFPHAFSVDDAAYIGGLSFPEEPRSTHSCSSTTMPCFLLSSKLDSIEIDQ